MPYEKIQQNKNLPPQFFRSNSHLLLSCTFIRQSPEVFLLSWFWRTRFSYIFNILDSHKSNKLSPHLTAFPYFVLLDIWMILRESQGHHRNYEQDKVMSSNIIVAKPLFKSRPLRVPDLTFFDLTILEPGAPDMVADIAIAMNTPSHCQPQGNHAHLDTSDSVMWQMQCRPKDLKEE